MNDAHIEGTMLCDNCHAILKEPSDDREKIQDLTKKVQYLLDAFVPPKGTFQYMFPDGDVWIVRPEECHFCEAKTLETQKLSICEGCARQVIEPNSK